MKHVHAVDRQWGSFSNAPARGSETEALIERSMHGDELEQVSAQRELVKRAMGGR